MNGVLKVDTMMLIANEKQQTTSEEEMKQIRTPEELQRVRSKINISITSRMSSGQ